MKVKTHDLCGMDINTAVTDEARLRTYLILSPSLARRLPDDATVDAALWDNTAHTLS